VFLVLLCEILFLYVKRSTYNTVVAKDLKLLQYLQDYFVEMGRKGGKIGGKKRVANMTPEERHDAARKAVQARWAKKKKP